MPTNGGPIGAVIGAPAKNPIGAPFGRKMSWVGQQPVREAAEEALPRGATPRRSQWDERGDSASDWQGSEPASGGSATSAAPAATAATSATSAPAPRRASMWDERGDGPSAAVAAPAVTLPPQRRGVIMLGQIAGAGGLRQTTTAPSTSASATCGTGEGGAGCRAAPTSLRRSSWDEKGPSSGTDTGVPSSAAEPPAVSRDSRTRLGASASIALTSVAVSATEADLKRVFEKAKVPLESVQLEGKGQALAELWLEAEEDPEIAADYAVHRLSGVDFLGRPLTVEPALVRHGEGMVGTNGLAYCGSRALPSRGRKTQLCTYWRENRCTKGATCGFAHGEHELSKHGAFVAPPGAGASPSPIGAAAVRPAHPPPPVMKADPKLLVAGSSARKVQLCSYWKDGRCTRGSLCTYAHGEEELGGSGSVVGQSGERDRGSSGNPLSDSQRRKNMVDSMRRKLSEPSKDEERDRDRDREAAKDRGGERRRRDRSRSPATKRGSTVTFTKKDTMTAVVRPNCEILEAPQPRPIRPQAVEIDIDVEAGESTKEVLTPASFLLNEDGFEHLVTIYGAGLSLLQAMGWKPGLGLGRRADGWLEPVSVQVLELQATRRGRNDRRCVGSRPPKRFLDSDVSETGSVGASSSSSTSGVKQRKTKRSASTLSSGSSRPQRRRKRKKQSRKPAAGKRRGRSSRSISASSSSSKSSSSSTSSRKRRKRKLGRRRATESPPKASTRGVGGFAASAGATAGVAGAAAATGATGPAAAGLEGKQPASAPVNDPPEIAQAKKQVLAKLTILKNVEPKEQRAKQFRELLRQWHPDKNPEKIEMATAVFQFLQKGKSLLSLGAAAK